jgi:hypothetical protein
VADISVIICTCDRAHLLPPTLEAISRLQLPPGRTAEFLLIENGKGQGLRELAARQSSFRFIAEPRRGLSCARNRGIAESSGSVLVFTDDDVRPEPDWLTALTEPVLARHIDATTGWVRMAPELERPWMTSMLRNWLACWDRDSLVAPPQLVGASMAIGRHVFSEIPEFDTELGAGTERGTAEEGLFSLQMKARGLTIAGVPKAVAWHHFDASRLRRPAWLKAAEKNGRSTAYIEHHWHHTHIPHLRLSHLRAYVRYRFWRTVRRHECAAAEGIAEWELNLLRYLHRLRQHLDERGLHRRYDRCGLRKLTAAS